MAELYLALLLVGITILVVMWVLLRKGRAKSQVNLELLRLNEKLSFDLPDFLRSCWPLLERAGFSGVAWKLEWFGTSLSGSEGALAACLITRHLEAGEISLDVTLAQSQCKGEQRYLNESLSENFFLLLHVDMLIKMGAVQGAFGQAAKMELFLQHDMKNIAQYIQLIADQLKTVDPEQDASLLKTLRMTMPVVRGRAEHILHNLSRYPRKNPAKEFSLRQAWSQALEIHGLSANMEGDAQVVLMEESLHGILDNLVQNYGDQQKFSPHQPISLLITIKTDSQAVETTIQNRLASPAVSTERLFEPFWSAHSQGLGVGLYQARQQALALGGSLGVKGDPGQPLIFVLRLPHARELAKVV